MTHQDKHSEQGFALYQQLASLYYFTSGSSVGTRLNIAALGEAGQSDQRIALDDAEASLGEAWVTLLTQFALDETWPASASSANDVDLVVIGTNAWGHGDNTN